jgi:hypothetical protein
VRGPDHARVRIRRLVLGQACHAVYGAVGLVTRRARVEQRRSPRIVLDAAPGDGPFAERPGVRDAGFLDQDAGSFSSWLLRGAECEQHVHRS